MERSRTYSDELRRRGVEEAVVRGRKIPEVARDLGSACPNPSSLGPSGRDRPGTEGRPYNRRARRAPPAAPGGGRQQRTIEILKAATTFMRNPRLCGPGTR